MNVLVNNEDYVYMNQLDYIKQELDRYQIYIVSTLYHTETNTG